MILPRFLQPLEHVAALVLLSAVVSASAWGQQQDGSGSGPAASWTGVANPRVDSIFASVNSNHSPGCAIEILRDGAVLYSRGYGMANLQNRLPITPETSYDIGSVTKQFTAMSVMLLAQRKAISLDDDIRKYIPELPRSAKPVLIQNLLNQTSGIRDYVFLFPLAGVPWESVVTPRDALALLSRQTAMNFGPGTEWEYSNSNYFLLSVLVERVTGKPLSAFFQSQIFDPLAMRSTTTLTHHGQIIPNEADSYNQADSGFDRAIYNWETLGDGAIHTTLGDLARWDENFYSTKVGSPAIVSAMQQVGTLSDGTRTVYGTGLAVTTYKGLRVVFHNGGSAGFLTEVARLPDQHFSVITACNSRFLPPFGVFRKIADIYLAPEISALPRPAAAVTTSPRSDWRPGHADSLFVGKYFSDRAGDFRIIRIAGDSMTAELRGNQYRIVRSDSVLFRIPGRLTVLRLRRAPNGQTQMVESIGEKGHPAVYTKVREPRSLSSNEIDEYLGRYSSVDLDARWAVTRAGGKLVVQLVGLAAAPDTLQPEFFDGYSNQAGVIRFTRGRGGRVDGLEFWTQGARALPFRRVQ